MFQSASFQSTSFRSTLFQSVFLRSALFGGARRSVGSDILLARHGSAIVSLRLDRRHGQVVARLADGSLDSAPNLIDPALQMPGGLNDDTRLIAAACAATVGVAAVLTAVVGVVFSMASPDQLSAVVSAMGTYTPAM